MVKGILGKKIGTTQVFSEDGREVSVTVIEAGPCVVTQVKTVTKDGYEAVQLGFQEAKRLNSPERGHLKRVGKLFRYLREVAAEDLEGIQVGQKVDVSLFQAGEMIDVIGTSKGRGFAGVMRRHGFRGGPKTHGQSDRARHPGSIGATNTPGRVVKGMRMAGHLGNARVTVRNIKVVQADPERNLLLIRGSVPGATNGLVIVRKAGA
ncbi:MAG: 50S ribosomal protein L3 [Chloroflexi bacterium]|nr:50S ribosomal protein L3 [Chloroflexota bacterium]